MRSVVLASREHTCIHPTVSKTRNKNEGCRQLLEPKTFETDSVKAAENREKGIISGGGCRYFHGVQKIKTHDNLAHFGMDTAWDIEDLVTLGKQIKACPYFTARSLMSTAEIVICPYNYLVDPLIRESMDITLTDQVIVLDEAHNIEDCAREAASCTLTQDEIHEASQDLGKLAEKKINEYECTVLFQMLNSLSGWVNQNSDKLTDYTEFDRSGKIFKGTEMIAHLDHLGIGHNKFPEMKGCLAKLTEEVNPEDAVPCINSTTRMLLKNLFLMFNFLYMDDMRFGDDFRVALVKEQVRKSGTKDASGWFSRKKHTLEWSYSINFWCLNPAVAFSSVGADVRSIILTSGTLSPMSSFQSELGVPFKIQLEANHVVDKSQVWVGTVGKGPTDQMLQATYRHTETWGFQDELGRVVLDVCKVVPRGVLCFLPSYAMLNKLVARWQNTGMWNELNQVKVALIEPRSGEEFEETIAHFYEIIKDTRMEENGDVNGAFFMAVCRGKVSEGLDFTDDNARAVIAVGIPFPNVKDIQIDLKRRYNDQHCRTRGLLSGNAWYEIQAYRAINQALGRCIRHRYDWGALILVDERYQRGSLAKQSQQNKYTHNLSKWVRNNIVHTSTFSMALSNLCHFTENMIAHPPVKPESLDETVALSKDVEIIEPTRTNSHVSMGCNNSKMLNRTINEPSHSVTGVLKSSSPYLNPVSHNLVPGDFSTEDSNKSDMSNDPPKNYISVNKLFSATIINEPPNHLTDLNINEGDLLIPPGKLPFTSTQITVSGEAVPSQVSDTKTTDEQTSRKDNCFVSASTPINLNPTLNDICMMGIAEANSERLDPPSKRKKSSPKNTEDSKTDEVDGKDEKRVETSTSRHDDVYTFKYMDETMKPNVSPLKLLLKYEIGEKSPFTCTTRDSKTKKNYQNSIPKSSRAKKSLEFETPNLNEGGNEASVTRTESCSPQLFNSDEDDQSPVITSQNVQETALHHKELPGTEGTHNETTEEAISFINTYSSFNCMKVRTPRILSFKAKSQEKAMQFDRCTRSDGKKERFGSCTPRYGGKEKFGRSTRGDGSKEKRGLCNKTKKQERCSKMTSSFLSSDTIDDDPDLDDFNLNESFCRTRDHRKLPVKRRAASLKGVQFTEYNDA